MWLESISLKNFRNYTEMTADFSSGLNVFLGQNAQGKTNFLEAIYFLALTRSHRTRSDKELINFKAKDLSVSGLLRRRGGKLPLEIDLSDTVS
uniref:AAA family ATPase n=1 Tax=Streptococcus sobrinus TaxID=1310 RepID=UPI000375DDEB